MHLIEKVLKGHQKAFDSLITEFRDTVISLAYQKLGAFSDAEDVAQEAFIRVWYNLKSLEEKTKFPAWLYTITINLCTEYLRKKPKMVSLNSSNTYNQPAVINKEYDNRDNFTKETMQAVNELTELQQQVLTLRFQKGLSGKEIARHLGESPDAVRAVLYRAIKSLRVKAKPLLSKEYKNGM